MRTHGPSVALTVSAPAKVTAAVPALAVGALGGLVLTTALTQGPSAALAIEPSLGSLGAAVAGTGVLAQVGIATGALVGLSALSAPARSSGRTGVALACLGAALGAAGAATAAHGLGAGLALSLAAAAAGAAGGALGGWNLVAGLKHIAYQLKNLPRTNGPNASEQMRAEVTDLIGALQPQRVSRVEESQGRVIIGGVKLPRKPRG